MAQKRNTQMQRFLLRFFTPVNAQTAHASSHSSVSATDNCFNTYFNTLISRWQVGFEVCSPLGSVYTVLVTCWGPLLPPSHAPFHQSLRVIFSRKGYHTIAKHKRRSFSVVLFLAKFFLHVFPVVATESASLPWKQETSLFRLPGLDIRSHIGCSS